MAFSYDKTEEIEKKLGYTFTDKELLKKAFTHSTYSHLHGGESNERLEFLGDAILGFAVAEALYEDKQRFEEGKMTLLRASRVNKGALAEVVKKMEIAEYLLYEGTNSNVGEKTISSIFEAVTAAIYFDGGFEKAREFILSHIEMSVLRKDKNKNKNDEEESYVGENYKGRLQEFLQGHKKSRPYYVEIDRIGKDNQPTFYIRAIAAGKSADGKGGTIKEAEQEASKRWLELHSSAVAEACVKEAAAKEAAKEAAAKEVAAKKAAAKEAAAKASKNSENSENGGAEKSEKKLNYKYSSIKQG